MVLAIEESDLIIFMVDVTAGIHELDKAIANLRLNHYLKFCNSDSIDDTILLIQLIRCTVWVGMVAIR